MAASFVNTAGQTVIVNDDYDCEVGGTNDGFVRPLTVVKDKYYVVWFNDYQGSIGRDGVRMSFNGAKPPDMSP